MDQITELPGPTGSVIVLEPPNRGRQELCRSFEQQGFSVICTDSMEIALTAGHAHDVRIVAMEAVLNGVSTLPAIPRFRRQYPEAQVAICTIYGSIRNVVRAMRAGANSFMIKPVTAQQVLSELVGQRESGRMEHPSYHRAVWEYVTQCRELAGSLAEASRRLNLDRRSLRRMLQKLPPAR